MGQGGVLMRPRLALAGLANVPATSAGTAGLGWPRPTWCAGHSGPAWACSQGSWRGSRGTTGACKGSEHLAQHWRSVPSLASPQCRRRAARIPGIGERACPLEGAAGRGWGRGRVFVAVSISSFLPKRGTLAL